MTKTKKQAIYDEALVLLDLLTESWPAAIKHEDETPMPLKRGIRNDIEEELGDVVDKPILKMAMCIYCRRTAYRRCLTQGAVRVDLHGDKAGLVTKREENEARAEMRQHNKTMRVGSLRSQLRGAAA
jgi:sRNA-binding protein